jgi:hypothetical protein
LSVDDEVTWENLWRGNETAREFDARSRAPTCFTRSNQLFINLVIDYRKSTDYRGFIVYHSQIRMPYAEIQYKNPVVSRRHMI